MRGRVALVFATLFAAPLRLQAGAWDTQCYADTGQARRIYRSQRDAYQRLTGEHPDKFCLVKTGGDLQGLLAQWRQPVQDRGDPAGHDDLRVGLTLLMEGAEAIGEPSELEEWWQDGVRLIGPAWAGNRFCGGTREPGPLTGEGFALLETMAELGFGLDLSHMDEQAALQALDAYPGPLAATHSNARDLLKGYEGNRHLSDRLIQGILERQGVIGVVLFNAFLKSGWRRGDRREEVGLEHVAAQIDYICQIAGDAAHVGIGSDFDGGFGLQCIPHGMDTIADLSLLAPFLAEYGYSQEDIVGILGGNWLSWLERLLPGEGASIKSYG
jgi:membrane dipeptidase